MDDEEFGLDDFDESAILQIDAIESKLKGVGEQGSATHTPPVRRERQRDARDSSYSHTPFLPSDDNPLLSANADPFPINSGAQKPAVATSGDGLEDASVWDDSGFLADLDLVENDVANGTGSRPGEKRPRGTYTKAAAAGSSRQTNGLNSNASCQRASHLGTQGRQRDGATSSSLGLQQRDLFGGIASQAPSSQRGVFTQAGAHANTAHSGSSQGYVHPRTAPGRSASTKQWDRSAYATNGRRDRTRMLSNTQMDEEDCEGEWENSGPATTFEISELDSFPPAAREMRLMVDREAARTWIYPTNKERRDYQLNIVQRALFNNVLVALPTGLGKTFIAAVVILNYFRWYPQGKIIFVAPTKPLVAQQQQACHGICGLPWDTAVELTGDTRATLRGDEWKTKRIFYMTPQTFENDLCSTSVDSLDVACVVVDEAHRATGNFAYANVIRYLTARNPFFRVLALTATPGSKAEKVQEVVDNLHINYIEIRSEEALDIREYVHAKEEDPVVVPLGSVVEELKQRMGKIMQRYVEQLVNAGLINQRDPAQLHPFYLRMIYRDPRKREVVTRRKLFHAIKELGDLAQAMRYLIEHSVMMFAARMLSLETGGNSQGKKASSKAQQARLRDNTLAREMAAIFEENQDNTGHVRHPKMQYLEDVLLAHFTHQEQRGQETRAMVFCSYRECVVEMVDMLNASRQGLRATKFVGQSTDTKGNKGFTQKDQERVIKEFREGKFNVLIATSIGEEGLDIGDVDLIVCYEAVKDSVRMLQRVGRTGRKRDGRIVVLMSEGLEEKNWQASKDSYKSVQNEITKGWNLELYDDVPRLIPDDIVSEPVFQDVDQPPFEPEMIRRNRSKARVQKEPKPKRNSDPLRNIPDGTLTGFLKASDLRTGKGKRKQRKSGESLREGDSQSSEEEQEEAEPVAAVKIAASDSEDSDDGEHSKGDVSFGELLKKVGKRKAGEGGVSVRREEKQDKVYEEGRHTNNGKDRYDVFSIPRSSSHGRRLGVRRTTMVATSPPLTFEPSTLALRTSPSRSASTHSPHWTAKEPNKLVHSHSRGEEPLRSLGQAHTDTEQEEVFKAIRPTASVHGPAQSESDGAVNLSPIPMRRRSRPHPLVAKLAANADKDGPSAAADDLDVADGADGSSILGDHISDDDDEEEEEEAEEHNVRKSMPGQAERALWNGETARDDIDLADSQESPIVARPIRRAARTIDESSSPLREPSLMGPPLMAASAAKRRGVKRALSDDGDDEVDDESGASPVQGKKAKPSRSTGKKGRKRQVKKKIGGSPTSRLLFRYEAERDTDEEDHGQRDESDEGLDSDGADSSDREHVGDFEPTQAPKGYHQEAVYWQSMNSQLAPSPFHKATSSRFPGFEVSSRLLPPAFRGRESTPDRARPRRRRGEVSTPSTTISQTQNDSDDEYEVGSFVCSDEEILFEESAEEGGEIRSSQG